MLLPVQNATQDELKTTVVRFNTFANNSLVGTSWSSYSVFPCLREQSSDNFFYVKIDKQIEELQSLGYENVVAALAEAIAKTTNISVLRVSNFLVRFVSRASICRRPIAAETSREPRLRLFLAWRRQRRGAGANSLPTRKLACRASK